MYDLTIPSGHSSSDVSHWELGQPNNGLATALHRDAFLAFWLPHLQHYRMTLHT